MNIRFDDLPEVDEEHVRSRLIATPRTRRRFLGMAFGAGAAVAFGAFALINATAEKVEAAYYNDWTDTSSGPCAPGNYASNHTEEGRKCGPSTPCYDGTCCWRYRNGAGNRVGWHKHAPGRSGYYLHRPNECWGSYDAWHWRFSDGNTYRCSDGWTCSGGGSCYRSICPWAV
jgi:hypothetical protein